MIILGLWLAASFLVWAIVGGISRMNDDVITPEDVFATMDRLERTHELTPWKGYGA